MIYTVTLSPAIDYTLSVSEELSKEKINRSSQEHYEIGGKGINVSILLKNLNVESVALGFVGGFTGEYIKAVLDKKHIKHDFCDLEGITRINVKINQIDNESAINANGPKIQFENLECLFNKIEKIKSGDTLVLAGNIPSSLESDVYEKILEKLKNKEIMVVVDSTKQYLLKTLKYNPFLIKPNLEELEELFNTKLTSKSDIVNKAFELQKMGAKNILVSLGAQGALLIDQNKNVYEETTYKGKVISTVGSGDSMVAGFVSRYNKCLDFKEALNFGIACGAATAFNQGVATSQQILDIIKEGTKCA